MQIKNKFKFKIYVYSNMDSMKMYVTNFAYLRVVKNNLASVMMKSIYFTFIMPLLFHLIPCSS